MVMGALDQDVRQQSVHFGCHQAGDEQSHPFRSVARQVWSLVPVMYCKPSVLSTAQFSTEHGVVVVATLAHQLCFNVLEHEGRRRLWSLV